MLSALSRQGNVRFMLYEDSMNQQRLIQFMDRLIRTSNQKVFLILDNLKVHHGKKTAAWLDRRQDKIELFFLPPYAPESNPDEYLNHALKLSIHSGDLPSASSEQFLNYSWIEFRQLNSSIFGSELPVNFNTFRIAITCPSTNLLFETFHIRKRFSQSLAAHDANLYLSHV